MIASYHNHTWRCHHADGTEREYVENAIAAGIKILGFSDHTPQVYPDGFVCPVKMEPNDLEGYVDTILDLKREYEKDIEIHLGLEVEYFPRHFEALLRLCEDYPIEYFLLGQHSTHNEYDGVYSGRETWDEAVLKAYCDQVIAGLQTGRFLYVAHPDLIHYVGEEQIYDRHMRRMCREMKARGIPGEINFLGLLDDRNYPDPRFWRIAGEEGLSAVLGIDAHRTDRIILPQCEERARKIVREYGLHLIEQVL